jgi:hypothetical protein
MSNSLVNICFFSAVGCVNVFAQASFSPLSTGVNSGPGQPFLFADSTNNTVYLGGWISSVGNTPVQGMARWNGIAWDSMGSGVTPRAIVNYNGEIIVGGTYGSPTNHPSGRGLSKWNGNAWVPFADAVSSSGWGCVDGLLVDNNNLYVFGCFDSIDGVPANMIAKFDGSAWNTFPVLDTAYGGGVIYSAAIYNNELFVGGNFEFPYQSGRGEIAKWDGTTWQQVGNGITGSLASVGSLKVFNNELWVGGGFETAWGDSGNYLMKWNGNNWIQLPCEPNGFVQCLEVYNGKVYAGGSFNVPSISNGSWTARWDSSGQCESYGSFDNGPTSSFTTMNGDIYIGGGFTTVNGDTMNRITKYNDGPLDVNSQIARDNSPVYPNPCDGHFWVTDFGVASIYNVMGDKIWNGVVNGMTQIDLSSSPPGIYFLEIHSEQTCRTQQFVIHQSN